MSTPSSASNELFLLENQSDFLSFALDILTKTHRKIFILSNELDPEIYNNDDFVSALSQFIRSSRYAQVQVLVHNTQRLVGNEHKLVKLAQRLPSKISIRKIIIAPEDKNMAFMMCDTQFLLYKNNDSTYKGFANLKAAAEIKHLTSIFDYSWQYAEIDNELQQIVI